MVQRKKNKKTIKAFIFIIIFILFVFCIIFIVNVVRLKTIHFKNDVGFSNNTYTNHWKGNNTFNILVVYKSYNRGYSLNTYNAILSITPHSGISLLSIPSNLTIYTPGTNNQSTNVLDTIYPLSNLNKPKKGISVLMKDLKYNLGITINGYMSFSSKTLTSFSKSLNIFSIHNIKIGNININQGNDNLTMQNVETILSLKNDNINTMYVKNSILEGLFSKILNTINLFTLNSPITKITTLFNSNIGENDSFLMFYYLYNIGISKINSLELPYSGTINFKSTDSFIRSNFLNKSFSNSNISIQILDSSSNNSAVYQFSRYIQNLGGTVSSIGIYNNALVKDVIYVSNKEKYSYELKEIINILGSSNVTIINKNPAFFYTGSIIVILGSKDSYIL